MSFKIKNLEQIATLQSLGIKRIHYNPAKSDSDPLPAPTQQQSPINQAKRDRIKRLLAQQARAAASEREFVSTTRAVKSINQSLFSMPQQARQKAESLVQTMADSMLTDSDVAINLMKDQIGGEEVYFHSLNVTLLSMMLASSKFLTASCANRRR